MPFPAPPAQVLSACDIHPGLFKYAEIRCDAIGLDGRLPYEAELFTTITCTEVVEHLEDQFQLARGLFRVTRPGGRF